MSHFARDLLRATRPGDAAPDDRVKVLVALRSKGEAVRRRLEELGLSVETALRDKLIGSIAGRDLDRLRADPDVLEVETSVPLKPTAR